MDNIEDLRERMRLLQKDRRANVDMLEMNKKTNAEDVRLMRDENKELRVRLSQLARTSDESTGENEEVSERSERALMKTRIRATTKQTLFAIFWLARIPPDSLKMRTISLRSAPAQMNHLKKETLSMRSEYDSLKSLSNKHRGQLDKLKDAIKTCELDARRPNQEDNPLTRQIRILENR